MMAVVQKTYFIFVISSLFWLCDSQLASFKQLHAVDNEMSSFSQQLIDVVHKESKSGEAHKEALKNILVTGSTQEGSMTARVFKPSKSKDGLNREVEIDLEYNLLEIPKPHHNFIEDIPEKAGFVRVRMNKYALDFAAGKVGWKADPKEYEKLLPEVSENGYLKPYIFKEKVLENIKVPNRDSEIQLVLSASLNIEFDRIKLSRPQEDIRKSLVGSYVDILVDNEVQLRVKWNIATVMKLNWWPKVATEWIERERKWPEIDSIKELTRFSYITMDPSLDKDTTEMRYSFAHVERAIISKRSRHQAFVYLVFKSMIYKWIKPIDSDRIHSYIAKNIMHWSCEKYPPTHTLWSESSTIPALTFLFNELLKSIKENHSPYYFVPKVNVIDNMEEELRTKVIHQINKMLQNIEEFIPDNVNEVTAVCQETLDKIKATYKVVDDLHNEYYDIILKRPDLIPKALEIYGSHLLGFGSKKKDEMNKKFDGYKDTITEQWNQFQEDLNFEDVKKNIKESYDQVKEQFNLHDIEKKAKEFLKKFEL